MNLKTLLLSIACGFAFRLYAQTNQPPVDNFALVTNLCPTPAEVEQDRAKAFLPRKRMTFEDYLKWLHDDGLF